MIAFMVAGTASGVGKTTVALALMAVFRTRGMAVQPFKCGPDFLDTGHHSAIAGRVSRNLDAWMLDGEANRSLFRQACAGADVAIAEGMMGLFDGVAGGTEEGSSAEIAKLLGLPVVLVLNASTSARSIAAVVKGFECFDPELRIAGVVFNQVGGEAHFQMLWAAIRSTSQVPVLGWLPRKPEISIPERHLGLTGAEEIGAVAQRGRTLALLAEQYLDLDPLLQLEYQFPQATSPGVSQLTSTCQPVRVGVASDEAFSFYYEDNLDLLREHGAEVVFFSPLRDARLPQDLDAIYLGGGYPELHAERLSQNHGLLGELRSFGAGRKPVYAECGGLIYLGEELTLLSGAKFSMAGVLPIRFEMTPQLVKFGYVDVEFATDCLLGEKGAMVRGHSFHCSRLVVTGKIDTAYRLRYSISGKSEAEGYCRGSVLGSYAHLHFGGLPSMASSFVERAVLARSSAEVIR